MAKLKSQVQFIGTLDSLSAYTMRGVEGIVVRKKGGPSKRQIKKSPNFERTRLNNAEFGGRSRMSSLIRNVMHPLVTVADYNTAGPLNSLLKPVQAHHDVKILYQKKNIILSEHPDVVNGFSFNRKHPLESFLSSPASMQLSKKTMKVTVTLPEIVPGINFKNFGHYPYYRFVIAVGFVSDLEWKDEKYTALNKVDADSTIKTTDWLPCRSETPSKKLTLTMPESSGKNVTYLGGIGIQFGTVGQNGIEQSRFGAGKIVMSC